MTVFGDTDPEDAWSASDPPSERARIILRWAVSVAEEIRDGDPHHRAHARLDEALTRGLDLVRTANGLTPIERLIVNAAVDLLVALESET